LNHGFLADKSSWDDQFLVFAQHYKVIRYDLRGFGSSSPITEPYSQREDLSALLKFLGIEKAYLLGLSGSGSIAIDFTLEHPAMIDALIAVSSGLSGYQSPVEASGEWPPEWKEFIEARQQGDNPRAAEAMLHYWIDGSKRPAEQVDPVVRERVHAMLLHNYSLPNDPNSWDMAQPLSEPALNRLSAISIPTLIIVGDKDEDDTLATADILSAEIKGAREVAISNTTHHPNMEKPLEFNRAVLDFLSIS
jgi:3-oxoadipate enol-lactonase